jgi:hypothetical protein
LGLEKKSTLNLNFGSLVIGLPTLLRPQLSSSTSPEVAELAPTMHHMDPQSNGIIRNNGQGTERN